METANPAPRRRGVSAAALKWIAVVTMFIDHLGYSLYAAWVRSGHIRTHGLWITYRVMRNIGRMAFPIYCFLLVEGYLHTRDVKKYGLRLFLFGLISEIPFNLAFWNSWHVPEHQNVYFTLLLGLAAMWAWDLISQRDILHCAWWRKAAAAAAVAAALAAAHLLKTDYSWKGVLVIFLLFLLRDRHLLRFAAAAPALLLAGKTEAWSWPMFALFELYNGQRGRQPKYFFYAFYPAHLALLALAARWVASIPVT